jgi:hypothetical protein
LTNEAKEAIWIKQMLIELERSSNIPLIFCDNKSSISLATNPNFHSRSKHIDIRHHFIREKIQNKDLIVQFIESQDMTADILTKGLPFSKHYKCIRDMNMDANTNLREDVETNESSNICCYLI